MPGLFPISNATPDALREVLLTLCQEPGNREHALALIRLINSRNGNLQDHNGSMNTTPSLGLSEMDLRSLEDFINESIDSEASENLVNRAGFEDYIDEPIGFGNGEMVADMPVTLSPEHLEGIVPPPMNVDYADDFFERQLQLLIDETVDRIDGLPQNSGVDLVEPFLQNNNFPADPEDPSDSFNGVSFDNGMPLEQAYDANYDYSSPQNISAAFGVQNITEVSPSLPDYSSDGSPIDWEKEAEIHENLSIANILAEMWRGLPSHSTI